MTHWNAALQLVYLTIWSNKNNSEDLGFSLPMTNPTFFQLSKQIHSFILMKFSNLSLSNSWCSKFLCLWLAELYNMRGSQGSTFQTEQLSMMNSIVQHGGTWSLSWHQNLACSCSQTSLQKMNVLSIALTDGITSGCIAKHFNASFMAIGFQ